MQKAPFSTKKTLYIPLLSIGLIPKRHWLSTTLQCDVRLGILPMRNRQWLGWGNKKSSKRAKRFAHFSRDTSTVQLEDGFIRSIGLPKNKTPAWSMIYDPVGIYYDAHHPSLLEQCISSANFDQDILARAQRCIKIICQEEITKYNDSPVLSLNIDSNKQNILIVDQTKGDLSIVAGGASESTFQLMLDTALKNYPHAHIWIKTHPEVSAKHKQGHFNTSRFIERVNYITASSNPMCLIKQMDAVYVVSSQMGFEALMLNKPVYCFGLPWYAGWGLTNDQYASSQILQNRRVEKPELLDLFAAAYFEYTHYVDPYTNQPCELEQILETATTQKSWNTALSGKVLCVGFSPWKKHFIRNYLNLPAIKLSFRNKLENNENLLFEHIIVWGMKQPELNSNTLTPTKLWRMEDGFVRSVGLGAKLITPYSLVLDDLGIYYNAQHPSRLEIILSSLQLCSQQRQRAENLISTLTNQNISKYNIAGENDWPADIPPRTKVVLVVGQVSDDASIKFGASHLCNSNEQLLTLAREKNPLAYIIYKPHPDVLTGLRSGSVSSNFINIKADALVTQTDMSICIQACDELHTMTSLAGFEALLRNKKVFCYGQPFYSGWGLTTDLQPNSRRSKQLDLLTLVYGTLINYPVYAIDQQCIGANIETIVGQINKEKTNGLKKSSLKSVALLPFIKRYR